MTIEHKSSKAQAAVEGFRIIKWGTLDGTVIKAAAATDLLIGTSDALDKLVNEPVDRDMRPQAEVRLGGVVSRGQPLTSDANGKAVVAAPAAGVNNRIIGFAAASGVLDDVIPYDRALGTIQG